jgi:hypothetical protein
MKFNFDQTLYATYFRQEGILSIVHDRTRVIIHSLPDRFTTQKLFSTPYTKDMASMQGLFLLRNTIDIHA